MLLITYFTTDQVPLSTFVLSTRWEGNVVAILHIHGASAIFLPFYAHQDIGSESCEMEIGITAPIFTH